MRRFFAIFALLGLLCLPACSGEAVKPKEEEPKVPLTFETDLRVSVKTLQITAHYRQEMLGHGTITVTQPESINGLVIRFEGSKCQIQFKGLTLSPDLSKIPESAFAGVLMDALSKQLEGVEIQREKQDGKWRFTGNAAAGDFVLVQDAESGNYESLTVPALELTILFQNFTQF